MNKGDNMASRINLNVLKHDLTKLKISMLNINEDTTKNDLLAEKLVLSDELDTIIKKHLDFNS